MTENKKTSIQEKQKSKKFEPVETPAKDISKEPNPLEEKIKEDIKNIVEKKKETISIPKEEREFIIPLRRKYMQVPRYKRAKKAVRVIREYVVKHMKIRDRDLNKVRIDKYLNEIIWNRGIKKPPFKIKVKAYREGDIIRVEAAEMPDKLKFKKLRLGKRDEKSREILNKKKSSIDKLKEKVAEKPEEKTKEQRDEEEGKKAAVIESGQEMKKAAAKSARHSTKISKQPKRQQRQALQK